MSYWMRGGLVVALALALAACGGRGGGPGEPGTDDGEDLPTSATVDSDSDREAHQLAPGRYRLQWRAEPQGCRPNIALVDAASGETVYQNERPSTPNFPIRDIPGGEFYIDQLNDECTEWSISLDQY